MQSVRFKLIKGLVLMEPVHHKVRGIRQSQHTNKHTTYYILKYDRELMEQGACNGLDTELFYPPQDFFRAEDKRYYARLCSRCPILEACQEWGLVHEKYGIWGGMTPDMRTAERTRRGWGLTDPSLQESYVV